MTYSASWTSTHRFARILDRNGNAYLGFWFARDKRGSEFAVNLFGCTFQIWQAPGLPGTVYGQITDAERRWLVVVNSQDTSGQW